MLRDDLYTLVTAAVIDGLGVVQKALDNRRFIPRYYCFPKLDIFAQSGLPYFRECSSDEGPFDYKDLFGFPLLKGDLAEGKVNCDHIVSWRDFRDYATGDNALMLPLRTQEMNSYLVRQDPAWKQLEERHYTYSILYGFVDRYIHIANTREFNEEVFRPIYSEWESDIFSDTLLFDIWIPIICVRFDCEAKDLDGGIAIQRIPDDLQLARCGQHANLVKLATLKILIGAATHALVLTGWSVENRKREVLTDVTSFSRALPTIENFFAALRAVVAAETGYSQFVVKPVGWGHGWKAFLPLVYVASTRAYPDRLEDFGWLRPPPIVDRQSLSEIGAVFRPLNSLKNNSLAIAVKRLNSAHLRNDEADSIIDVTIGLEALLGDKSTAEMTHKLAMRMAALSKIEAFSNNTAAEVFGLVKKVYSYRSSVVHGSAKKEDKQRVIAQKGGEEIPLVELGLKLLRHAIRALTKHPEFLSPEKLDSYLLSLDTIIEVGTRQ